MRFNLEWILLVNFNWDYIKFQSKKWRWILVIIQLQKNTFPQKWPSKLLFCRKGSNIPYNGLEALYGLTNGKKSLFRKMLHYSETHSTSNSAKKEIKFNPRLAKNTQCSNSRFKPLKLHQTYNHTPTHRKWLRIALKWKI